MTAAIGAGRRRAVVRPRTAGLRRALRVAAADAGRPGRGPIRVPGAHRRRGARRIRHGRAARAVPTPRPLADLRRPRHRGRQRRSAARTHRVPAVRRHPAHLPGAPGPICRRGRGIPLLPAGGHLPQRAVRPEFDRALEAAGQRVQRLRAGELSRDRGRAPAFPGRSVPGGTSAPRRDARRHPPRRVRRRRGRDGLRAARHAMAGGGGVRRPDRGSTGSSLLDDHRLRRSGLGRNGLGRCRRWADRQASVGCRTAGGSLRPCPGCAARSSGFRGTGCRR